MSASVGSRAQLHVDLEVAVGDRHVEPGEQVRGQPGNDELAERVGDGGLQIAAPAGTTLP
jgi:hypothetical protein